MDLAAVKTAIKAILTSLTSSDASQPLRYSYGYPEVSPTGYPSASLYFLGGSFEEVRDSANNETYANFMIRLTFQNKNEEDDFDDMLTTITGILNTLRKDDHNTLSGVVNHFEVSPSIEVRYTDDEEPIMVCDIVVTARKLSAINL